MPVLELQPRHLSLLQQLLANHVPTAEVWAYGSRVTGGSHDTSDLDIVLRNPSDLTQRTANLPDLEQAIQDSLLPMVVDVHDWAGLPEVFHVQIEKAYVVIQSAAGGKAGAE